MSPQVSAYQVDTAQLFFDLCRHQSTLVASVDERVHAGGRGSRRLVITLRNGTRWVLDVGRSFTPDARPAVHRPRHIPKKAVYALA